MKYKDEYLYKMLVGSKLWGTNNHESDEDWLYIVGDDIDDRLLGKKPSAIVSDKDDTVWDVLTFHKLLLRGNTRAFSIVDMYKSSDDYIFDEYMQCLSRITNKNLNFFWSQALKSNIGRMRQEIKKEQSNKKLLDIMYCILQVEAIIDFLTNSRSDVLFWNVKNNIPSNLTDHFDWLVRNKHSELVYTGWDYHERVDGIIRVDYSSILTNRLDNATIDSMNSEYLRYVYTKIYF